MLRHHFKHSFLGLGIYSFDRAALSSPASAPANFKQIRGNSIPSPRIMAVLPPTVKPIQPPSGSKIDFGAQIGGIDLENISGMYYHRTAHALAHIRQTNNSQLSAMASITTTSSSSKTSTTSLQRPNTNSPSASIPPPTTTATARQSTPNAASYIQT